MSTPQSKLSTASEDLFFSGLVLAVVSPILMVFLFSPVVFMSGLVAMGVAWLLFLASLITTILRLKQGDSSSLLLIPPILGTFAYPLLLHWFFIPFFGGG